MIDFIAHNLAPIMFTSVMLMLLLGYPVAFTLAAGGLIYFVVGVELSHISSEIRLFWPLLQSHPERIYGIMYNDTLLSIPFFTLMGIILERSRMAEDLLDTIGQLFGPVRGGLAYAVILVGALLGATTGVVAASVMAMGLISLPIMLRYKYNGPLVSGTIAASGTLAQIVPPSLVLIVMADQLGRSVGDMYVGALYPALMIIAAYCLYIFAVTIIKPEWAPALPKEARTLGDGVTSLLVMIAIGTGLYFLGYHLLFTGVASAEWQLVAALAFGVVTVYVFALLNRGMKLNLISRLAQEVIIVMVPPLALIFLVLGTIFLGIATPTEGSKLFDQAAFRHLQMKALCRQSGLAQDRFDTRCKITLAEVMYGQIDGDTDRLRPCTAIGASLPQYLLGDVGNNSDFFRNLDEDIGRDRPLLRMMPSGKRFTAGKNAAVRSKHRLIDDRDAMIVDSSAQIGLQSLALQIAGIHFLGEERELTTTTRLRLEEGDVELDGPLVHFDIRAVEQDSTGGEANRDDASINLQGTGRRSMQASHLLVQIRATLDIREEADEVIAHLASDDRLAGGQFRQPLPDSDEQLVAREVPLEVVHMLEVGDVQQQHPDDGSVFARAIKTVAHEFGKIAALRQPRQRIVTRHVKDLAIRPHTGRHIFEDQNNATLVTPFGGELENQVLGKMHHGSAG